MLGRTLTWSSAAKVIAVTIQKTARQVFIDWCVIREQSAGRDDTLGQMVDVDKEDEMRGPTEPCGTREC